MNNNLNTSCYLGDHGNYETGVVCLFCKSFSNTMKLHKGEGVQERIRTRNELLQQQLKQLEQ